MEGGKQLPIWEAHTSTALQLGLPNSRPPHTHESRMLARFPASAGLLLPHSPTQRPRAQPTGGPTAVLVFLWHQYKNTCSAWAEFTSLLPTTRLTCAPVKSCHGLPTAQPGSIRGASRSFHGRQHAQAQRHRHLHDILATPTRAPCRPPPQHPSAGPQKPHRVAMGGNAQQPALTAAHLKPLDTTMACPPQLRAHGPPYRPYIHSQRCAGCRKMWAAS